MGRLSKQEWDMHERALNLVRSDANLTFDQKLDIIKYFRPSATNNVSKGGAFFTPYELAELMHEYTPPRGHIVDICAGIGILSLAISECNKAHRPYCDNQFTCIEINPDYVEVGKRLMPEANWIQADVYDKETWSKMLDWNVMFSNKKFDYAIMNPPFGRITAVHGDKNKLKWLHYSGAADLMACEIVMRVAREGVAFIPQMSAQYMHSYKVQPSQRYNTSINFMKFAELNPGINIASTPFEMEEFDHLWQGTHPKIEMVNICRSDDADNLPETPQRELFEYK